MSTAPKWALSPSTLATTGLAWSYASASTVAARCRLFSVVDTRRQKFLGMHLHSLSSGGSAPRSLSDTQCALHCLPVLIRFWARVTNVPGRLRWIVSGWLAVVGGCLAVGFATGGSPLAAIVSVGTGLIVMWPPAVISIGDAAAPKPPIVRDSYTARMVDLPGETRLESVKGRWFIATCKWRVTEASHHFEIVRAKLRRRMGWHWVSTEGKVSSQDGGFITATFEIYVPRREPNREEHIRIRGTATLIDGRYRHHRYPFKAEAY